MPISFAVGPFIRSSSLYTLTAKRPARAAVAHHRGARAIAIGRGDALLGREVIKGRVAYIAAENPDDLRMRLKVAAYLFNIDLVGISNDVIILDQRMKPEELVAKLKILATSGGFSLIVVDTLAAVFDRDNINDPVQGGRVHAPAAPTDPGRWQPIRPSSPLTREERVRRRLCLSVPAPSSTVDGDLDAPKGARRRHCDFTGRASSGASSSRPSVPLRPGDSRT